jgi:hypothetical protein
VSVVVAETVWVTVVVVGMVSAPAPGGVCPLVSMIAEAAPITTNAAAATATIVRGRLDLPSAGAAVKGTGGRTGSTTDVRTSLLAANADPLPGNGSKDTARRVGGFARPSVAAPEPAVLVALGDAGPDAAVGRPATPARFGLG